MELIQLQIKRISYNQSHIGSYTLILEEFKGSRKLPIIIGSYEAQSIALALENDLITRRPVTHDLFVSFSRSFELNLKFIIIYKIEKGVFYSNLFFEDIQGNEKILDSRTSDAIALAIRFTAPIFTNTEVLNLASVILDFKDNLDSETQDNLESLEDRVQNECIEEINIYDNFTTEELNFKLHEVLENEDYENAALIRDELQKRKKEK